MSAVEQSLDLDAIKARAGAASPGPWEVSMFDSGHSKFEMSVSVIASHNGDSIADMDGLGRTHNEDPRFQDDGLRDADFIAHARDDIPALVAEVKSLTAQLQAAQATIAEALSYFGDGETAYIAKVLRRADTSLHDSAILAARVKELRDAAQQIIHKQHAESVRQMLIRRAASIEQTEADQ